jgi:hypothetical protein
MNKLYHNVVAGKKKSMSWKGADAVETHARD